MSRNADRQSSPRRKLFLLTPQQLASLPRDQIVFSVRGDLYRADDPHVAHNAKEMRGRMTAYGLDAQSELPDGFQPEPGAEYEIDHDRSDAEPKGDSR